MPGRSSTRSRRWSLSAERDAFDYSDSDRTAGRTDLRGPDAGRAAGIARLDDRGDRAADDRRRPRGNLEALLDRHRLSARLDRDHSDLRQARRHLRPQARASGRARDLPRRLGALRAQPEHDRADRVPRRPGARRRRAPRDDPGGDRRHRLPARTRPVLGFHRRHIRDRNRARAADRRLDRRPRLVALDLLREPADRDRRLRRAATRAARSRRRG